MFYGRDGGSKVVEQATGAIMNDADLIALGDCGTPHKRSKQ